MLAQDHMAFLKSIHLFNGLDENQFEKMAIHSRLQTLKKDERLFTQGDNVNNFYIVYSGLVKLFRLSAEGQEKVIEIVSPGQSFGEALMFLERPDFPVSSSALSQSEIIVVDSSQFLGMLSNSPATCLALLGGMSQRIRGLIQEIDNLSVQNGRCRLSAYILEQAGDGDHIKFAVAKSVLASRLSIQPETFSRILKQLRSSGAISIDGSEIHILDRDQLEDYAMI